MANQILNDSDHQEDHSYITITVAQVLESAGTIAAAGSSQTTATQIIHAIEWVTGANGTKGVILPVANAAMLGATIMVKNDDTANAVLNVYPANATDVINALSATTALAMGAKTSCTFNCTAVGQWHTVPLLPS